MGHGLEGLSVKASQMRGSKKERMSPQYKTGVGDRTLNFKPQLVFLSASGQAGPAGRVGFSGADEVTALELGFLTLNPGPAIYTQTNHLTCLCLSLLI